MSSVPFHYLDLRAFCYVTEDDQRVEAALRHFLAEETPIERAESKGHYGDRILVLSTRVESADGMRSILETIEELPPAEYDRIAAERADRVDEDSSFFLTLDKQAAFNGETRLGNGITLRGKVEAYPATRDRAIETLEAAGVP